MRRSFSPLDARQRRPDPPRVRVLHLHDAPRIRGGATSYLLRLIEEAHHRDHVQGLFCLDEPFEHPLLAFQGHFAYSWPTSALRRRRDFQFGHEPLAAALREALRAFRPDLVHVQNWLPFRTTVFPVLWRARIPVVMTPHDYTLGDPNPSRQELRGLQGLGRRIFNAWGLSSARKAAFLAVRRFLAPTEALARDLRLPPDRTELLRLPIAPVAEPPPWPDDSPPRLLFAGSLFHSKGVDLLLQALARAGGPAAEARLEVAGEGDRAGALLELRHALGLEERVRFLGHLGSQALDEAYGRAHLLVLPSRVPENSPLTVLEAGARGRPALAPAAGGVPELLPPDRGWTFRPGDADDLARSLERALADPAELRRRGAALRAWVEDTCSPERHWRRVEEVWREVRQGLPIEPARRTDSRLHEGRR